MISLHNHRVRVLDMGLVMEYMKDNIVRNENGEEEKKERIHKPLGKFGF